MFGTALSAELDKQEGKDNREVARKRQRVLQKWIPEASGADGPKFRDPAAGRMV